MNPLLLLAVGGAAGVGAGLRYLLDTGVGRMLGTRFPWGILVVNIIGSFTLGLVTGIVTSSELSLALGTGLLGGFTTFSTVMVDTWTLGEAGKRRAAWANGLGTLLACVAAAGLGLLAGAAFTGHL